MPWEQHMQHPVTKKAGLDVEHIQKNYLWSEGGKMAAMSLLMLAVAVVVGYLASRVGAGVGRDLKRENLW